MKRLLQITFASSLVSCIVEAPIDHHTENQRRLMDMEIKNSAENSQQNLKPSCRLRANEACITGALIASPELTLNEKTYFDAEEIGYDIPKMLRLDDETSAHLNLIDYSIQFVPALNNQNFSQGFSIYLKGSKVEQSRTERDGSFQFDQLIPGEYQIRAQKNFTLRLDGVDSYNERIQKIICLTIFSDQIKVELKSRASLFLSIENYYMKLNSSHCLNNDEPLPLIIDF